MDIVCGAILRTSEGSVLLQDHVKSGMWSIPVGRVEEDEHPLEALCRELREELGIVALKAVEVADRVLQVPNYGPVRSIVFHVDRWYGDIKNLEPDKCKELRYVERELPGDVTEITKLAWECLWW